MLFLQRSVRPAEIRTLDGFFIDTNAQLLDATLRRFDSVWRSKLEDGELPAREDIDPSEIADLLPYIMLADVSEDGGRTTIEPRLVGEHHLVLSGAMPGRIVVETGADDGALDFAMLDEIAERQQPHYAMLRVECSGQEPFEAARTVYPLSTDGVTIDRIVSVVVPYLPAGKGRGIEALIRR